MLPLSFESNYDRITVLKQSANRAVILANILCDAPRSGFPHVLEAFLSYFKDYTVYTPAGSIVLMYIDGPI